LAVAAGTEISVSTDAGGSRITGPRDVTDKGAFKLLAPTGSGHGQR
jgi:hypothetical protein